MAQGDENTDPLQEVLNAISASVVPRGYLTTEWWTTIIGGALSAILALVHVGGSNATHIVAVAAPALLAAVYAIVRTMHKSALASALTDIFPQAVSGAAQAAPASVSTGTPAEAHTADPGGVTSTPIAQTTADFAFEGIPPIEDSP